MKNKTSKPQTKTKPKKTIPQPMKQTNKNPNQNNKKTNSTFLAFIFWLFECQHSIRAYFRSDLVQLFLLP